MMASKEIEAKRELHKQLAVVQKTLKAGKTQRNDFGKYNYRSTEDILEAVKPLLGDCVILLTDQIKMFGERVYVEATATFTNGEHSITAKALAREPAMRKGMDESQITGSTSSYARKYALCGLLLIDGAKDADAMDNRAQGAGKQKSEQVSSEKTRASFVSVYRELSDEERENLGINERVLEMLPRLSESKVLDGIKKMSDAIEARVGTIVGASERHEN